MQSPSDRLRDKVVTAMPILICRESLRHSSWHELAHEHVCSPSAGLITQTSPFGASLRELNFTFPLVVRLLFANSSSRTAGVSSVSVIVSVMDPAAHPVTESPPPMPPLNLPEAALPFPPHLPDACTGPQRCAFQLAYQHRRMHKHEVPRVPCPAGR